MKIIFAINARMIAITMIKSKKLKKLTIIVKLKKTEFKFVDRSVFNLSRREYRFTKMTTSMVSNRFEKKIGRSFFPDLARSLMLKLNNACTRVRFHLIFQNP